MCQCTLACDSAYEERSPRFFIVLPTDLYAWDDLNLSTHKFRLYYLCNIDWRRGENNRRFAHFHFANHPGYILDRPQEFFRAYGDYVIRMLKIVRKSCEILRSRDFSGDTGPLQETLENQSDCVRLNAVGHLPQDFIQLADKAIKYLERLSLPRCFPRLELTQLECIKVKAFFDIQDGDNSTGHLCRFINNYRKIYWMCQDHAYPPLLSGSLEQLSQFVSSHGGYIDSQLASLSVTLQSDVDLDQFCSLLRASGYTFDISIKLGWKATRSQVTKLCSELGQTMVLEIDGIDLSTHPPDYVQYKADLFVDQIIKESPLMIVILQNYPRPQEQCVYIAGCSLHSPLSPTQSAYDWMELKCDVECFRGSVEREYGVTKWTAACKVLRQALAKHGWSKLPLVGVRFDVSKALFDLEKQAIVNAHLLGSRYNDISKAMVSSGHLRKVTLDFTDLPYEEAHNEWDHVMRNNGNLQELRIALAGGIEIGQVSEYVFKTRRNTSGTICLTLFDRTKDDRGRVTAQVAVVGQDIHGANSDILGLDSVSSQGQDHVPPSDLDFLQWDCDHSSLLRSDYLASLLDRATQQHPTVLTLFSLDISHLSKIGLTFLGNVLGRSSLEYLHISCTPFDPSLSESVRQLLGSVQWSTIKFLAITGTNMDEWMRLWPAASDPRLLSLDIRGPKSALKISRSSSLLVHYLICSSPLTELRLENVEFQHKDEWMLIIESLDPSLLETFFLCEVSKSQFLKATDAVDLFKSMFLDRLDCELVVKGINYEPFESISDTNFYRPTSAKTVLDSLFPKSRSQDRIETTIDGRKEWREPSPPRDIRYAYFLSDILVYFDTTAPPPTLEKDVVDLSFVKPAVVSTSCDTTV
ncbi:hypothetical protein CPB97_009976 [Podila verticillata]|nr:hypothetical protein CPB97_009976 [Podila verticillata]